MLDFRIYKFKYRSYGSYFNNESVGGRVVFDTFQDGLSWLEALKSSLERADMTGLCGEYVCVDKRDTNLEIELAGWNYEDDIPSIIIKKESLLKNIDIWIDLVEKGTPEIAIIYHDKQETIEVIDRRSNPRLCLIDINRNPVEKKEYDFVLLNRNFNIAGDMRTLDNDLYLSMLSLIFTSTQEWTHMVEQALRDSHNKIISYQDNSISIEEQNVKIQSTHYYKPEEYTITIAKSNLISLIKQWNELITKNVKSILIKRYENQNIIMEEYIDAKCDEPS